LSSRGPCLAFDFLPIPFCFLPAFLFLAAFVRTSISPSTRLFPSSLGPYVAAAVAFFPFFHLTFPLLFFFFFFFGHWTPPPSWFWPLVFYFVLSYPPLPQEISPGFFSSVALFDFAPRFKPSLQIFLFFFSVIARS